MRVVFFRHGIAVPREEPGCPPDPDRPLTRKGEKRTRAAAAGLRALGVAPDVVLTSPYLRARQTATIAAAVLGIPQTTVQVVPGLTPEDPPGPLFTALARHAGVETVLVTGHAPHLDLALRHALDRGAEPLWGLKKAGAACVELTKAGKAGGRLLWLLEPAALRALANAVDDANDD